MEDVVQNTLTDEGMRVVKVLSDSEILVARYQAWVRAEALQCLDVVTAVDPILGLHSLELRWPVFEPYEIVYWSPKGFRRFMLVHYSYAARVSECIEMAVEAFFVGTHHRPGIAYVRDLPEGAEDGMMVHGVILLGSEQVPRRCVAVGGSV